MTRQYFETAKKFYRWRDAPTKEFLDTIVDWARDAPDEIFAYNSERDDFYSHVQYKFGPWRTEDFQRHRRGVMLEVIRVLAGFESNYDWKTGRDVGAGPQSECQKEAGVLQVSGDSMNGFKGVGQWAKQEYGVRSCRHFRKLTWENKQFAIEYCARLLRETYKHHGPLKRKTNHPTDPRKTSIHPFFSLNAVDEFRSFL